MATTFNLRDIGLSPGQHRVEELALELVPYLQAGQEYADPRGRVPATLDVTAMDSGWSFRLRFHAEYEGPCSRCLDPARAVVDVDAHEVHDPDASGEGAEELRSEHVDDTVPELDVTAWAQELAGLEFPTRVLCMDDCRGLCPQCGADLNENPDHAHEQPADSRWDALKGIRFDKE